MQHTVRVSNRAIKTVQRRRDFLQRRVLLAQAHGKDPSDYSFDTEEINALETAIECMHFCHDHYLVNIGEE